MEQRMDEMLMDWGLLVMMLMADVVQMDFIFFAFLLFAQNQIDEDADNRANGKF